MEYCAYCDTEAIPVIKETDTPICSTCSEVYQLGANNQHTIEEKD